MYHPLQLRGRPLLLLTKNQVIQRPQSKFFVCQFEVFSLLKDIPSQQAREFPR